MRAALGALGLALVLAGAAAAETKAVVEFLTIAANEDGAAGGHAALRIGGQVFHFQAEQGRLRLVREPWPDFRFRYRVLENRSFHASRLALSPEEVAALERHLDRRLWIEAAERRWLDDLRRDVALLEALARRARGRDAALLLPGAGFFAREGSTHRSSAAGATAIRALRSRIARELGSDFPERRWRRAVASLRALSLAPAGVEVPDAAVPTTPTFSRRYDEALSARLALEVLREAPPLREAVRVALPDHVAALTPGERRALRAREQALETELVRLAVSQRPDWGFAFTLGQARLAALAESVASGRLVVLDAPPAEGPRVDADTVARVADSLGPLLLRRRAELEAARQRLIAAPASERDLARLEASAARYAELARALSERADLRLPAKRPLVPRGVGRWTAPPLPDSVREDPRSALAAARERLRKAQTRDARRYDYDLFANNCVTALFREMETVLPPSPAAAGGVLRALRFAPLVAERAVGRGWPVAGERTLPSYRHERLAALRAAEGGWLALLRESNTLTSTLYEANPADSPFLFFTDRRLLTRPLLGAANLATGLVDAAAGLLLVPWDGGEGLLRGARGAAASLPELVFVNVRKGTYPFAEPPAAPAR